MAPGSIIIVPTHVAPPLVTSGSKNKTNGSKKWDRNFKIMTSYLDQIVDLEPWAVEYNRFHKTGTRLRELITESENLIYNCIPPRAIWVSSNKNSNFCAKYRRNFGHCQFWVWYGEQLKMSYGDTKRVGDPYRSNLWVPRRILISDEYFRIKMSKHWNYEVASYVPRRPIFISEKI